MPTTVAGYALTRLKQIGVGHLFGIPGTSCAALFDVASKIGIKPVLTSSELEAGYAGDAYARLKGASAVSVSYGVGTLSMVNAIASAFAERSAVVILNGGPRKSDEWFERRFGVLFSHSIGRQDTDLNVFRHVCEFAEKIVRPEDAPDTIDRAIQIALNKARPVYIEIPSDLWDKPCAEPVATVVHQSQPTGLESDYAKRILEVIAAATQPAILLGIELHRYQLQDEIQELLADVKLPWATTMLAKSILDEGLDGFSGVYDSDLAPKPVRKVIEQSDALISLGSVFGVDHTQLLRDSHDRMIHVADESIRFGCETPQHCDLKTLIIELRKEFQNTASRAAAERTQSRSVNQNSYRERRGWAKTKERSTKQISYELLFETISENIQNDWLVICDTCLGSYPAADLAVRGRDSFIGNPVWLSIGHSVGAAVGALHSSERRPFVICGDGGLQTIVQGLSSIAAYGSNPIVLVIDNGTYAIEQYLIDPRYFEDPNHPPLSYVCLNRWDYVTVADGLGFKYLYKADTEETLKDALVGAVKWDGPGFISVRVDPRSLPPENQPN
ncbi:MAG: hypothetical protein CME33_09395 [Gimesia sp.]|uniref:thiamine pyrophosphate-binding protein n=1 Tax=Gimesia sp. TaxID=2024833 RepID=UPI000C632AAF|nr:thiamine pyrophosphate-binding protein [Gimesia sp.]MAX36764.1 hypothetical protein [Gimesia sp.]|tara:strand:+ start:4765 stop:6438 length:1674 start_codon:yes stop_codon:yes gene_type:complete